MKPEQAWEAVLGQLQTEMPKTSFDTWVRDTKPASFEDGVFTVGVRNEFARDWLESRLSSTVSRLLIGIMDRDVTVLFQVSSDLADQAGDEPVQYAAGETENDSDQIAIDVVRSTQYREEVEPDKVIVLPGYCLRLLWHKDVAPKQLSLWTGFHQAVWRAWKNGKGAMHNVSWRAVCEYAMMSRAAFFDEIASLPIYQPGQGALNESADLAPLQGLVERIPIEEKRRHYRNKRGRLRTIANRYRVYMDPRLSRADAAAIYDMLKQAAAGAAGKELVAVTTTTLLKLCQVEPDKYLPKLEDEPPASVVPATTVMDIVRLLLGMDGPLPEGLGDAAEMLHNKIIGGFGLLYMTQYFARVVAPGLGLTHPQVWLINAVRDRTWKDPSTGATRDYVIVENGYADLGRMVGCQARRVRDWLADDERGCPKSAVSCFLAEIKFDEAVFRRENPGRFAEWRDKGTIALDVRREEPVVSTLEENAQTNNHGGKRLPRKCADCGVDTWETGEAFVLKAEVRKSARKTDQDRIGLRRDQVLCVNCAENRLGRALVRDDFEDALSFERRSALLKDRTGSFESPRRELETLVDANLRPRSGNLETPTNSNLETLVSANLRLVQRELETPFKSLNLIPLISKDSPSNPSPIPGKTQRPTRKKGGVGKQAYWDLKFLLNNNQVRNEESILDLQKTRGTSVQKIASGFVSWLLYAYSPQGERIDDPVSLAVKRLQAGSHAGAGGDFDRLAGLRPYELKAIFDKDFAGDFTDNDGASVEEDMYMVNFQPLDGPHKRALYRRLFGEG